MSELVSTGNDVAVSGHQFTCVCDVSYMMISEKQTSVDASLDVAAPEDDE